MPSPCAVPDPLASANGRPPAQIADSLGFTAQTVRNAIRAFQAAGIDCLDLRSHRPASARAVFDGIACERLRALFHRSPRNFGEPTSLWTLALVAQVATDQGMSSRLVSDEAIRLVLARLGVSWRRAKHWITSPDPAYPQKKATRPTDGLGAAAPDWALGSRMKSGGVGWRSRTCTPGVRRAVAAGRAAVARTVTGPQGLGLLRCWCAARTRPASRRMVRFVDGRPVSRSTQFLDWCCQELARGGKSALPLVWDNASWHYSKEARGWIRAHNRQVKRTAGCGSCPASCP